MKISSETLGRLMASGRNYLGQGVAFAAGIGVMSAAQQKDLMDAVGQMVDGVTMVVQGATNAWAIVAVVAAPVVGPILARWASNSAKVGSQAAAVRAAVEEARAAAAPLPLEVKAKIVDAAAALPEVVGDIKVTDPALAVATESEQVKSAS